MKRQIQKYLFGASGVIFMLVLTGGLLVPTEDASAIPAWARKYKTSCATCHIAFPKMTAFGEAFRRNGFQFPSGTDAEFTREEPVSLGAEGQKRAFPDAIWPGSIPGTTPVAFVVEQELEYSKDASPKLTFNALPGEVAVLLGGTLGESVSFYGEMEVAQEGIELERVYMILDNIAGPRNLFNLKIGQFEPGLFYFSNHRRYGPRYFVVSSGVMVGDNNFSLEPTQQGLEVNGVLGEGRLAYNLGLVEGRGNVVNARKDFYIHGTYKFGGMRLDGVVPGNMSPLANSQPWRDNSFTIGGFGYFGKATLGEAGPPPAEEKIIGGPKPIGLQASDNPEDSFRIFGGDVQIFYDRLNLFGAVTRATHDSPFIASPNVEAKVTNIMGEANIVAYPWLVPFLRFESVKIDDAKQQRIVPGITALMRANVRIMLFSEINKIGDESFEVEGISGSIVYGF